MCVWGGGGGGRGIVRAQPASSKSKEETFSSLIRSSPKSVGVAYPETAVRITGPRKCVSGPDAGACKSGRIDTNDGRAGEMFMSGGGLSGSGLGRRDGRTGVGTARLLYRAHSLGYNAGDKYGGPRSILNRHTWHISWSSKISHLTGHILGGRKAAVFT